MIGKELRAFIRANRAALIAENKAGVEWKDLGARYGVSGDQVRNTVRRPDPKGRVWPEERIARLTELVAIGLPYQRIADALGCSKSAAIVMTCKLRLREKTGHTGPLDNDDLTNDAKRFTIWDRARKAAAEARLAA